MARITRSANRLAVNADGTFADGIATTPHNDNFQVVVPLSYEHLKALTKGASEDSNAGEDDSAGAEKPNKASSKSGKAKVKTSKMQASVNTLPHGLGLNLNDLPATGVAASSRVLLAPKTLPGTHDDKEDDLSDSATIKQPLTEAKTTLIAEASTGAVETKKKRNAKAGVILGTTPYPDLVHPTIEEAHEVAKLLSREHGDVKTPDDISVPSRDVAGCGEVKFTLEALIRTMISAHTSMGNANNAIEDLSRNYQVFDDGLTEGCVNWDLVRRSGKEKLEQTLKRGGMQKTKARDIIGTLQKVFEENQAMRVDMKAKAHVPELETKENVQRDVTFSLDATLASKEQRDLIPKTKADIMASLADQILRSDQQLLTLDYMHAWPVGRAFEHLQTFPGVGVKTAACVLLFCMQRPFFAVDTHVFRICKWLGWAPEKATRDQVFAHCDVRVPDELKYALHQLMIVHGKLCVKCKAAVGEKNPGWKDATCVLEQHLTRTGKRKTGVQEEKPKKRKMEKAKVVEAKDEESAKEKSKHPKATTIADTSETGDEEGIARDVQTPPKRRSRGKKAREFLNTIDQVVETGEAPTTKPKRMKKRSAATPIEGNDDTTAAGERKRASRVKRKAIAVPTGSGNDLAAVFGSVAAARMTAKP